MEWFIGYLVLGFIYACVEKCILDENNYMRKYDVFLAKFIDFSIAVAMWPMMVMFYSVGYLVHKAGL